MVPSQIPPTSRSPTVSTNRLTLRPGNVEVDLLARERKVAAKLTVVGNTLNLTRLIIGSTAEGILWLVSADVALLVGCGVHIDHRARGAGGATALRAGESGHKESRDGNEADWELHDEFWKRGTCVQKEWSINGVLLVYWATCFERRKSRMKKKERRGDSGVFYIFFCVLCSR